MSAWVRYRFHADADDPRPITFPPPGPYWVTGYGDDYSIVVAYLRPGQDVRTWWSEASDFTCSDPVDGITFTDRFERPEWWTEGAP